MDSLTYNIFFPFGLITIGALIGLIVTVVAYRFMKTKDKRIKDYRYFFLAFLVLGIIATGYYSVDKIKQDYEIEQGTFLYYKTGGRGMRYSYKAYFDTEEDGIIYFNVNKYLAWSLEENSDYKFSYGKRTNVIVEIESVE